LDPASGSRAAAANRLLIYTPTRALELERIFFIYYIRSPDMGMGDMAGYSGICGCSGMQRGTAGYGCYGRVGFLDPPLEEEEKLEDTIKI
jgi:hypothetical protein